MSNFRVLSSSKGCVIVWIRYNFHFLVPGSRVPPTFHYKYMIKLTFPCDTGWDYIYYVNQANLTQQPSTKMNTTSISCDTITVNRIEIISRPMSNDKTLHNQRARIKWALIWWINKAYGQYVTSTCQLNKCPPHTTSETHGFPGPYDNLT